MLGLPEVTLRRPSPTGLVRPRLVTLLAGADAPGLGLVIAPPGAGKTTLLARAAQTRGCTAWCALGPDDRRGDALVHHLRAALSAALAACCDQPAGRWLGDVRDPGTAPDLVQAAVRALAHDRSGPAPPTASPLLVVVLDDVHELERSEGEGHLLDLVRRRPSEVRVLLGTRRTLALNSTRLRVTGELVEVDAEALRFRSWEVEELFRQYGEPLSPEAAAALTRRTGGWAAGLKLFHLATTGKPRAHRERAVADLGGRSRLLRSYLTRTVLDELDPARREFLLRTSTLGTLTGPLCDALLGRDGSVAVLEELTDRQFFTVAAEDGSSFRYHQVLQTLLEGLLVEEIGPVAATRVYARSAVLLEAADLVRDAARAYALAGDPASVARMVQRSGEALAPPGPWEPTDDPWLALAHARGLLRLGSWAAALEAFRRAESLLEDAEFRARCAEERAAMSVWARHGHVPLQPSAPRNLSEVARLLTRHTLDPVPHASPLARGLALLVAGDPAGARSLLDQVPTQPAVLRLYADLATAVADLVEGPVLDPAPSREGLLQRLEQLVLTADVEDQPWVARMARGLQAAVLVVTDPEAWRVDSSAAIVEECRRVGDDWGAMLLTGGLGAALAARGHPDAAPWLDRAAHEAAALDAPLLRAWVAAVAAATQADARPERLVPARSLARSCGLGDVSALVNRVVPTPPAPSVRPPPAAPAPTLQVRCLGAFALEVDGRPLPLPELRPLPRTLLLMLVVDLGRQVHREVLIDRLWSEAPLEVASHRLHAAASSLRRSLADSGLGDRALQCQGHTYRLALDGAVLDVAEFQNGVREAARARHAGTAEVELLALERALDAYRGDLLPEAGPAEWVLPERERLRSVAATAAYAAADLARTLRSPAGALPLARRATELDPLRQSSWQLLAEVQAAMGDAVAAARTSRTADRVLAELL